MRAMELPARAELEAIAVDAGNLALRHFRHVASERKADRTLVTAADREVEAFLVAALRSRLPEAGILGEERSEEHTSELQSQSNLVCRLLLEKKKQEKR